MGGELTLSLHRLAGKYSAPLGGWGVVWRERKNGWVAGAWFGVIDKNDDHGPSLVCSSQSGGMGSGINGMSSFITNQAALDHFQSIARVTNPFRTGFSCT